MNEQTPTVRDLITAASARLATEYAQATKTRPSQTYAFSRHVTEALQSLAAAARSLEQVERDFPVVRKAGTQASDQVARRIELARQSFIDGRYLPPGTRVVASGEDLLSVFDEVFGKKAGDDVGNEGIPKPSAGER